MSWEYVVIPLAALITSALTLFSGFGLGTLLTPAFVLFFDIEVAVALTAIVHFANNLFKLGLLGRNADRGVVLRFGLPAILAAIVGALALKGLSDLEPLTVYRLGEATHQVTLLKIILAVLIVGFALFEIIPRFEKLSFDRKYLPVGGLISGFFGGLSGHQGALRAAFLVRAGLTKEAFIATGVVIACLVDLTRLPIYFGTTLSKAEASRNAPLLVIATLAAFLGAFVGNRLMKKVTLRSIQLLVSGLLLLVTILLAAGLI